MINVDKKCELKELVTYKENHNWYMKAVYETEDEDHIYEVNIPKIKLLVYEEPVLKETLIPNSVINERYINIGFGDLLIDADKSGVFMTKKVVSNKPPKKMTLEEIEKELEYKIELVSKKKGE